MDKKDLSISHDDLADIFGGSDIVPPVPAPAKKAAPAAPPAPVIKEEPKPVAKKPDARPAEPAPVKSKLILDRAEEAYKAQEAAAAQAQKKEEHSVDDLIKRAQEIEKQMAAPAAPSLTFADFIDEKTVSEIIHAFNDLKSAFSKELAGKIDQKAVDNLMLRSIEKTSAGFMLLKNTTWDPEGQLKQDGSIDTERFVKNMSAYREQIQEIDKEIEETLKALMLMRLSAVKKGLGMDKYAEIKNGLLRRSSVIEGGYRKAVSKFVKINILENSIRKADEEK